MDITLTADQLACLLQPSAPLSPVLEAGLTGSRLLDPFVGKSIVVRTVTMTLSGRLASHDGTFMALTDAAWIADSGRWADALGSGLYSEVEPFPNGTVLVGLGGVIDVVAVAFDPPRTQK